ncbi:tetratricopeptide repeat protein [Romeria aff. gracilis LEGE 07310]|uniref:Tetratricopeptide repeat protein n=1 Tax=Vasconcelosia minhoensis LEGE 07310 TaxID=915328 RepID=A0A8J7A8S4_9CYAN|nr:tetratricopeptide repeat protein [Romeria gracilis]MBE9079307.1 tetratricopeptide repeat protein [Romeria aff. gracilis LEGE 07310]
MQPLKNVTPFSADSTPSMAVLGPRSGVIRRSQNSQPQRLANLLADADAIILLRHQVKWEMQRGAYRSAIDLLDRLIQRCPETAEYYNNRGLVYFYCQQYELALIDLDCAIRLNPELDQAYNNRANCYAAEGRWDEALSDYDQAIDLNPVNLKARINQGITFRDLGCYEEAMDCFDIALFFQPTSANLYAELGRTYHLSGDWNGAIAAYDQALTLLPLPAADSKASVQLRQRLLTWTDELLNVD